MLNLFQDLTSVVHWLDPDTSQAILSLVSLVSLGNKRRGQVQDDNLGGFY